MILIPDDDRITFIKILISRSTCKLISTKLPTKIIKHSETKHRLPEILRNPLPYEYCQNNNNTVNLMYFKNHKNK